MKALVLAVMTAAARGDGRGDRPRGQALGL